MGKGFALLSDARWAHQSRSCHHRLSSSEAKFYETKLCRGFGHAINYHAAKCRYRWVHVSRAAFWCFLCWENKGQGFTQPLFWLIPSSLQARLTGASRSQSGLVSCDLNDWLAR